MESLFKGTVLLATAVLAGCTSLPVDGPAPRDITSSAVVHAATDRHAVLYDYALVDLSPIVFEQLDKISPGSIYATFGLREYGLPRQRVGVGDVLQVSVFESTAAGPFQSAEGGVRSEPYVTLPAQLVDTSGTINVPYAGAIRVSGRTTREIERDIESKLASRAVEPQVVVSLVEHNSSAVTVIGEGVAAGNRFKLTGTGERILDLISRAGGTRFPGYEIFVTLQRGNRSKTVHFSRLIEDPKENIRIASGDTLYVFRKPQKFVAGGAIGTINQTSGLTGQFAFDQERLSLSEALAKAGGLQDARADPSQVFIYREEHRDTLAGMGINLAKFPPVQQWIPTIYRANFRDPSSFIFAGRFQMRHQDLIYVANSDSTEVVKFLTYARTITSTISGVTADVLFVRDAVTGGRVLGR